MRRLLLVAVLGVVVLCGCGRTTDQPSPSPSPTTTSVPTTPSATPTPTPRGSAGAAVHRLRAALDRAADWDGVRIVGRSTAGGQDGRVEAEADLGSGAWRAQVRSGSVRFAVRSRYNTTWVRGDARFWTSSGYTPGSARRADGRWVLMDKAAGDRLREQLSPERLLARARTAAASVDRSARAERGSGGAWRVVVDPATGSALEVSGRGPARLLAVDLSADGTRARFDVEPVRGGVRVDPPPAREVVQP